MSATEGDDDDDIENILGYESGKAPEVDLDEVLNQDVETRDDFISKVVSDAPNGADAIAKFTAELLERLKGLKPMQ